MAAYRELLEVLQHLSDTLNAWSNDIGSPIELVIETVERHLTSIDEHIEGFALLLAVEIRLIDVDNDVVVNNKPDDLLCLLNDYRTNYDTKSLLWRTIQACHA